MNSMTAVRVDDTDSIYSILAIDQARPQPMTLVPMFQAQASPSMQVKEPRLASTSVSIPNEDHIMYSGNVDVLTQLLNQRLSLVPQSPATTESAVFPRVNIYRKEERCLVAAELSGLSRENVTVEVKGRTLRIAGKRTIERDPKASVHRQERRSYEFDRSISMPFAIDPDRVMARIADGILEIELHPDQADLPKRISVQ